MIRDLVPLIALASLTVACHRDGSNGDSARPGAATIVASDARLPRPRVVWPSGPLEVRVAFDEPIDDSAVEAAIGPSIAYGPSGSAGADAAPSGTLRVAGGRLADEGRTLVLATDPHPCEGRYTLTLRGLRRPGESGPGSTLDVHYTLSGVEVSWTEEDAGEPSWSGWWPDLDAEFVRASTAGSVEHQRGFEAMKRPGRLSLRSLVTLPEGTVTVRLRSGGPIEEAALAGEPGELSDDGQEATLTADAESQAVELLVTLRTDTKAPSLHVSVATGADSTERPLKPESLTVPWSPGPAASESPPTLTPPSLAGGDARRGAAVFFSEEAKCSACHKFQGRGGEIGPDLTNLSQRDAASIFRDIAEPSAVIHPDYLPFTVSTFDGRVAVGVVRAEGADAIRVLDTNAQATRIPRDQIADLQPSRTSIMPVGLAGAIGEDRLRDLIAFLTSESKGEK